MLLIHDASIYRISLTFGRKSRAVGFLYGVYVLDLRFVCTCDSNATLNFQIEILKIERGVADMPFFQFLVEITSVIYRIEFW